MPFQKGHKKEGGRKKGSPNRKTLVIEELVARLDVDPLEVLLLFTKGDWKALGYESESIICYNSAGVEYSKLTILPEHRISAAKEAVKYLYSQKKSVDISSNSEEGFKIMVQDYTVKK
jgi:hypothetical protein